MGKEFSGPAFALSDDRVRAHRSRDRDGNDDRNGSEEKDCSDVRCSRHRSIALGHCIDLCREVPDDARHLVDEGCAFELTDHGQHDERNDHEEEARHDQKGNPVVLALEEAAQIRSGDRTDMTPPHDGSSGAVRCIAK